MARFDNASGTAALLEIAKAFTKLATPPKRSILFLAVTAEEKGLLGAKYYATNPLYPLNKTLANINMDGVNQWGRTKDMTMVGDDNSTLIDLLRETELLKDARSIRIRNRRRVFTIVPIILSLRRWVCQRFTRIPVRTTSERMRPTASKSATSTPNIDYHKVSDQIKPDWDLSGAVEDAQMLTWIGYRVAQADKLPEWKAGSEFKAKRDQSMQTAL